MADQSGSGPKPTRWALFRDGIQISRAHPTRDVAMVEAFERRVVIRWSRDFSADREGATLASGYEVREVPHAE